MDLDLAQVRAFMVAAQHMHFGRAANELMLTQQALSKRIQRLERLLGTRLFDRNPAGVTLTDSGYRFLPYAHRLVADADAAVTAARPESRPLRVDVWGHVQEPIRMVHRLIAAAPRLALQISMRRSTEAALAALQRGEIDAAFGRIHDLMLPWPADLANTLVRLAPTVAAVSTDHPLADALALRPADLRRHGLWISGGSVPPEVLGWYRQFAEHFHIQLNTDARHIGVDDVVENIRHEPRRISLVRADGTDMAHIRRIQIRPRPLFPWSLVWRKADQQPLLSRLLQLIAEIAKKEEWLAYESSRDWMPDVDVTSLLRQTTARE